MRRKHNKIPKLHVKKGDTVKILSGDDRGVQGRILSVNPKAGTAVVEDVNMVTKHIKPNQKNERRACYSSGSYPHQQADGGR